MNDVHTGSEYTGSSNTAFVADSTENGGLPFSASADFSMPLGGEDVSNIEDLLYTTDWTGLMADWNEM